MNDTLGQYIRTGNPSPAPAPAPTYTPPAQQNYVPDEEYVTGAAFRREAQQYVTATQEQLNALTEMSAQNALAQVQREFGKEFQRFGPTINANLAALRDKKAWTVDNLRRVVKYSLADHVEEIAGDIAARRLAEMEPTLRSNGAAPVQVTQQEQKFTLQSDALPEQWKKQAQEAGLTEQAVDEFCRATNTTREAFFGMIGKTAITEAPRR